MKTKGALSVRNLLTSQVILCNLPVLILVVVASLDAADKALLGSSFPLLERELHMDVETLGYFSMFTNLSYAFSMPLWGWLVHKYGMQQIHLVLSAACFSWGAATIGIALSGGSVVGQAIFRSLNGMALGSILPLSQTMLVSMVAPVMRGRAFGYMGMCENLAGTVAASSIVYFEDWKRSYYVLGFLSVAMALIAKHELTPGKRAKAVTKDASGKVHDSDEDDSDAKDEDEAQKQASDEPKLTVRQILQRIAQIPAFVCLVAQGVFGGIPWDMMSFVLLLMDWRQFTKEQIVALQFATGIAGTFGKWLGGSLGDFAFSRWGNQGRIGVAFVSVMAGIPLYGMFCFAKTYWAAFLYKILFQIVASWPPAGALRPICADLARNPSERAQIVSLWIVMEKTSGSIFGAPLVGYLTSHMMAMEENNNDIGLRDEAELSGKANALALNLFGLSTFFWVVCAAFWVGMSFTIDRDLKGKETQLTTTAHRRQNEAGGAKDGDELRKPLLASV
ncbi:Spinster homolog [Seminavis robusta]|uniref:Spinster homolog n=1 Tax=Seminavis robusta TaxID=568900 RepID=A0A9N8H974_9STRA|nr:Spinster homolog [Seminavis robusta]|eukprot:Sro266_g103020.1 Spinster homolog (505) ;mRNA; f:11323-12837